MIYLIIFSLIVGGAHLAPFSTSSIASNITANSNQTANQTDNSHSVKLFSLLVEADYNCTFLFSTYDTRYNSPLLIPNIRDNVKSLQNVFEKVDPKSLVYSFCRSLLIKYWTLIRTIYLARVANSFVADTESYKLLKDIGAYLHERHYIRRYSEFTLDQVKKELFVLNLHTLSISEIDYNVIKNNFNNQIPLNNQTRQMMSQIGYNTDQLLNLLSQSERNSIEYNFIRMLLHSYVKLCEPLYLDKERVNVARKIYLYHLKNNIPRFDAMSEPMTNLRDRYTTTTTTTTTTPLSVPSRIITHPYEVLKEVDMNYHKILANYDDNHDSTELLDQIKQNIHQVMDLILDSKRDSKPYDFLRMIINAYHSICLQNFQNENDQIRSQIRHEIYEFNIKYNVRSFSFYKETEINVEDLKP